MYETIKSIIQALKNHIYYNSNPLFFNAKWKSQLVKKWKFGEENKDEVIYFITDASSEGSGIFAVYLEILTHISAAYSMGWIPIVDDTPALFRRSKHEFRKKENILNFFLEFNNKYTREQVLKSSNVIISSITDIRYLCRKDSNTLKEKAFFYYSAKDIEYWRNLSNDRLSYRKNIQIELDKIYRNVIGDKREILGVAIREGKMGMSQKGRLTSGESEQPAIDEIVEKTKELMTEWKCNYIYLSCESEKNIEIFKEVFGENKIIYLERVRLPHAKLIETKTMKQGVKVYRNNRYIQTNYKQFDFDYIKDMYILSKCECCILPKNCGTEIAFMKNEKMKNCYIWER